jgi:hypothetical protein
VRSPRQACKACRQTSHGCCPHDGRAMSRVPWAMTQDRERTFGRKGDVLRVNSVDRHYVDVWVPEASPWGPNCIWSRTRRERVQRHLGPHPLILSDLEHPARMSPHNLGVIIRGWKEVPSRHLSNASGLLGTAPEPPAAEEAGGGGDTLPSSRMSLIALEVQGTSDRWWRRLGRACWNSGPNTADGSGRASRRGDGS